MEKKTYISPAMKIHALALHSVMQLVGGSKGKEDEFGETKQTNLSFEDEFDSENEW